MDPKMKQEKQATVYVTNTTEVNIYHFKEKGSPRNGSYAKIFTNLKLPSPKCYWRTIKTLYVTSTTEVNIYHYNEKGSPRSGSYAQIFTNQTNT